MMSIGLVTKRMARWPHYPFQRNFSIHVVSSQMRRYLAFPQSSRYIKRAKLCGRLFQHHSIMWCHFRRSRLEKPSLTHSARGSMFPNLTLSRSLLSLRQFTILHCCENSRVQQALLEIYKTDPFRLDSTISKMARH